MKGDMDTKFLEAKINYTIRSYTLDVFIPRFLCTLNQSPYFLTMLATCFFLVVSFTLTENVKCDLLIFLRR